MNWKTASTVSLNASAKALRKWEIPTNSWIDVFDVPKALGVFLMFRPMGKLGAAVISEPGSRAGIIVNSNHPLSKQRYSVAHELGHIYFNHPTTVDVADIFESAPPNLKTKEEKLAESFASWFLMPPSLMDSYTAERGIKRIDTPAEAYQMALFLGTSYEATINHLQFTKRLSRARAASLLKTQPRQIKKRTLGDDLPDWRNDVHVFGDMDNKTKRLVRPGDRLIFELPEIPSSGYRWRVAESDVFTLAHDAYGENTLNADGDGQHRTGHSQKRRIVLAIAGAAKRISTTLKLQLARSWESNPERIFTIECVVEAPRLGLDAGILGLAA